MSKFDAVAIMTNTYNREIARCESNIKEIESKIVALTDDAGYPALFDALHSEIDFMIELTRKRENVEQEFGKKRPLIRRILNLK